MSSMKPRSEEFLERLREDIKSQDLLPIFVLGYGGGSPALVFFSAGWVFHEVTVKEFRKLSDLTEVGEMFCNLILSLGVEIN